MSNDECQPCSSSTVSNSGAPLIKHSVKIVPVKKITVVDPVKIPKLTQEIADISKKRPLISYIDSKEFVPVPVHERANKTYYQHLDELFDEFDVPKCHRSESRASLTGSAIMQQIVQVQRLRGENKFLLSQTFNEKKACEKEVETVIRNRREFMTSLKRRAHLRSTLKELHDDIATIRKNLDAKETKWPVNAPVKLLRPTESVVAKVSVQLPGRAKVKLPSEPTSLVNSPPGKMRIVRPIFEHPWWTPKPTKPKNS